MPQNVYIYNPNVPVPKNVRHVEIPKGVTVIGAKAFKDCSDLQSVTIPEGVTEIRYGAFYRCSNLQSVAIPNSVTYIGNCAFYGCSGLQSVTIPDSVTEIRYCAFYRCSGLQSVTIPDGVTEIGDCAFFNCSDLQSVTIPDGVTEIGCSAFAECSGLQSVTIPDSVTEIGDCTFSGCSGLQSVTIPDSVTKIDRYAFSGCHRLQAITIPEGVTAIGRGVFEECDSLRSVAIPNGITGIHDCTFSKCHGLQSITIPKSVKKIVVSAFNCCSGLQSVIIPDGVTGIDDYAFSGCAALQSLIYKSTNIAPFINIDGDGANTFDIIKTLIEHRIPLSGNAVKTGIDAEHRGRLSQWIREYPIFGEMRLSPAAKSADKKTAECLRQAFAAQKKTGHHVPKILNELAISVRVCEIPPERLAATFDIRYTKALLRHGTPLVPAEVCRCYYDRNICDMLIRKNKISVMAEVIALYNKSGHQECYKHLMDFIRLHPDTRTEDLLYATDHAEKIPMREGTTPAQVRQHRTYMENLAEVTKIEAEYGETVPGFKLSDYPCNIDPIGVTYDGMTARVLDLSDGKDIGTAARLGELTNCCQRLGKAGETAMMHGFLNPDAGFWVIEDKDGKVKAQAEIWESDKGVLVFDNIEFADTDDGHRSERAGQLRGVIAAWAAESRYRSIIVGCGYNELGTETMEQAPIPELRLTPEEVFALQKDNDANVSFRDIDRVRRYMQTEKYNPNDFVYTDAKERCVYIKKDGVVSDYLMQGYDRALTKEYPFSGRKTVKDRGSETACK